MKVGAKAFQPRPSSWSAAIAEPVSLPHAQGEPTITGVLKDQPEDFIVDEVLSFTPSGAGEHTLIRIEKKSETTDQLVRALARFAGIKPKDVGYAGLKDRQAITRQWFSLPGSSSSISDWSLFDSASFRVLEVTRNDRKLRRGAIQLNRFHLRVRGLTGEVAELPQRLDRLAQNGVPNYFGPQRFGRDGMNVSRARALLADPSLRVSPYHRGLYLSAARSELFNQILADRVRQNLWDQAVAGDVFMFQGSKTFFGPEPLDETLLSRLSRGDIHPSGPLIGRTPSTAEDSARRIEETILAEHSDLVQGLSNEGLETQRRPFRLIPMGLDWALEPPDELSLSFDLPAGSYATTVLRELIRIEGPATTEL